MSNIAANNVVGLNVGSIYSDIEIFLQKHASNSEHTRVKYEGAIKKFFMYFRNKEIEQLTVEDLKFRNADVIRYQLYLSEQLGYSNATVNTMLAAIGSLFEWFEKNEYNLKAKVMKVDNLPDDSESYGELELEEVEKMIELVQQQRVKGLEKALLIKMAVRTSFRKDTLLNLKWSDIKKDLKSGKYTVTGLGKVRKIHTRGISDIFYNELQQLKEFEYYQKHQEKSDKIFTLAVSTIQLMMDDLLEKMGIKEERRVCFHSFRHVGADLIVERTGDIKAAQRQLNHADANVTIHRYLSKKEDYSTNIGVIMDEDADESVFDGLSREQMLELLKGTTNGTKMGLIREAKEKLGM